MLVVVGGVAWIRSGLERSVAAYCQTWKEEGTKLHRQWSDTQNGSELGSLSVLIGAPRDLADFLEKLARVAPDDIRSDVERYRDAWNEVADNLGSGAGLLDILAAQASVATQTASVERRIDRWTNVNCSPTS